MKPSRPERFANVGKATPFGDLRPDMSDDISSLRKALFLLSVQVRQNHGHIIKMTLYEKSIRWREIYRSTALQREDATTLTTRRVNVSPARKDRLLFELGKVEPLFMIACNPLAFLFEGAKPPILLSSIAAAEEVPLVGTVVIELERMSDLRARCSI